MFIILATKEWQQMLRNHTLPAAFIALLVMLGIAFAGVCGRYNRLQEERSAANIHFRQQWEQLQVGDPHSAAHFGTYIFKPVTLLSSFDKGLDNLTGYTMRVEAHVQHSMATPSLRPADIYLRFGELTMASVLQLFFPLFILFCCFNSYTQEKTSGTLRLLLLQGASPAALLNSKAGFNLAIVNSMLLLGLLVYLPALFVITGRPATGADLLRMLLLIICYAVYSSIFVLVGILVSALAKNARQSLIIVLGIWLLWNVLMPRLMPVIGQALHPLPSRYAIQEKIEKAIKMGIHGDAPRESRQAQLTQEVLKKYHVTSVEQLPVNLTAILMQANEDYTQMVYDTYAAQTDSIIRLQNNITRYAAYLNPYLAIRSISMALCGTDYDHQWHFDKTARQYRNTFIRRLNNELAYGGSKTEDVTSKVNPSFYSTIPAFRYQPLTTASVLHNQRLLLLSLLLWLPGSVLLLNRFARHAQVQ
ncbi:DUF3526 domain-containing protein [Chitinophaga sp. GbtcB8]|uniref:ABC transporter permease n=1 Tax=Chitinophaga sp. GbtcB8 TaxID=2824753 RepID=UPI001C2F25D4|nr:DUF3526 domain-containing protein [Chitinophaga sp. GbtcB8]